MRRIVSVLLVVCLLFVGPVYAQESMTLQEYICQQMVKEMDAVQYEESIFSGTNSPVPWIVGEYPTGDTLGETFSALPSGFSWVNPDAEIRSGSHTYMVEVSDLPSTVTDGQTLGMVVVTGSSVPSASTEYTLEAYHGDTLSSVALPSGVSFDSGYDLSSRLINSSDRNRVVFYKGFEGENEVLLRIVVKGERVPFSGEILRDVMVFSSMVDRESIGKITAGTSISGWTYRHVSYDDDMTPGFDGEYVSVEYDGKDAYVNRSQIIFPSDAYIGYARISAPVYSSLTSTVFGSTFDRGDRVSGKLVEASDGTPFVEVLLASGSKGYVPVSFLADTLDSALESVPLSGYVQTDVKLRSRLTGEVVGVMKKDSYVSGYESGNWLIFPYEGKVMMIASAYVGDTKNEVHETGYLSASIYVRPSKGSSSSLGILLVGSPVTGIVDGAWLKIQYDGRDAYIARSFLTSTSPEILIQGVLTESIYVRPSKGSKEVLTIYPEGKNVSGFLDGAWVRISYGSGDAYIARAYVSEMIMGKTSSSIYVRPYKGASSYLGILSSGSDVVGIVDGAWVKIAYNGETGYVAKRFISE